MHDLLATDNKHGALRVGLELAKSYFLDGNLDEARAMISKVVGWAADAEFVSFLVERQQEFEQLLSTAREDLLKSDPGLTAFLEQATGIGRRRIQRNASYADRASKNALTKREISIIELIADGQSNKQIARMLGVAPETIKTHVKRIFVKLSAETRVQAVIRAQSLGLVCNIQAASTSEAMGAQAL